MKKILIINGPNLNLLGTRQPEIYGDTDFGTFLDSLRFDFAGEAEITYCQSNHEGIIIDAIQQFDGDGIVLNAAAYTHTSLAIADAIAAVKTPVVEVHISNIFAREEIRRRSLIAPVSRGSISGFGLKSYKLAILSLL
ncbi:MAG: 3-dehydroquinate dehydratase [Lachnoclostridium sp.]|nr:3-dehydroquinate dehydratase [Lachnoclostridium sp.]